MTSERFSGVKTSAIPGIKAKMLKTEMLKLDFQYLPNTFGALLAKYYVPLLPHNFAVGVVQINLFVRSPKKL